MVEGNLVGWLVGALNNNSTHWTLNSIYMQNVRAQANPTQSKTN